MPEDTKELDGDDLLRNSTLYREFQAEREEILKHKWIESEKAGYDIGFERALTDWILKHRSKWRAYRQALARQQQAANSASTAGPAPQPSSPQEPKSST
ncbi:hypothetical protein G4L39_08035 [Limisphaera ngatamarikiensis]|uniref:DUF4032 domain-containing protein n=1 Tax=Limisphaera ngatamarikiensis TaxID=1324935 RepID=A0A6M1RI56_9BACT|nr:hypothetical protein [Limisphaera ngatamarikiensis]NGO39346.1 hypothetical protein [Limisphaera ngatamarikiensis]